LALEQEVKLAFDSPEAARQAVSAAGGRLVRHRRLIDDRLFDDERRQLQEAGAALRVRLDGERCVLTWKGPATRGPVKSREELETGVDDAGTLLAVLTALGYYQRFRSQKYREEYEVDSSLVTIDETPLGCFVEIEATPARIAAVTIAIGKSPADYKLESYPTLWRHWCTHHGRAFGDMLLPAQTSTPDSWRPGSSDRGDLTG
jgi:predicted adenylyl cyclase CyaB